jgi:hypothetical protein
LEDGLTALVEGVCGCPSSALNKGTLAMVKTFMQNGFEERLKPWIHKGLSNSDKMAQLLYLYGFKPIWA